MYIHYMLSIRLSSVCRLSNVRAPYSGIAIFSAMFLRQLVRLPSADSQLKFYRDGPSGTPPSEK